MADEAALEAARLGALADDLRRRIRRDQSDPGEPLQELGPAVSALAVRADALGSMAAGLRRTVRPGDPEVQVAAEALRDSVAKLLAEVKAEGEAVRVLGEEMRRILRMHLEAKDLGRRQNRLLSSAAIADYEATRLYRDSR
jgi:hypothetical protein